MVRWRAVGQDIHVTTATAEYVADRLVLALGPWLPRFLDDVAIPLTVERQVQYWFEPRHRAERFTPDRLPIALWETRDRMFYTLPDFGDGVKVAVHHQGEITDPELVRRSLSEGEDAVARALVERFLPDASGALRDHAVCLYTNTPDGHFLIDRHPRHREVVIVSACSGHGFKFASAVGESVARLVVEEDARQDLSLFRFRW